MSQSPRHGFPLAGLFVLLTICAVLPAMERSVIKGVSSGDIEVAQIAQAIAIGAMLTMFLGVIVGAYHHERLLGMTLGGTSGVLVGALIGALAHVPPSSFASVAVVALVGSMVLVSVGAVVRLASRGQSDGDGTSDGQSMTSPFPDREDDQGAGS